MGRIGIEVPVPDGEEVEPSSPDKPVRRKRGDVWLPAPEPMPDEEVLR